jgi:hypothetical protein
MDVINYNIMMGVFVFVVKMLEMCDLPYFHFLSNVDLKNLQLHDSLYFHNHKSFITWGSLLLSLGIGSNQGALHGLLFSFHYYKI